MKEIPELECKIESGALNFTNISQAQSYLREIRKSELKKSELNKTNLEKLKSANTEPIPSESVKPDSSKLEPNKALSSVDKLNLLESLENKSTREGQKILMQKLPQLTLPKERERILSATHSDAFLNGHKGGYNVFG
ncbi:MAG: hypothetical protein H6625_02345 [Bdellovibrionaceae bacterium]|nr:hypothetical protein [Pseudobdellovibrionaceae bacterium]